MTTAAPLPSVSPRRTFAAAAEPVDVQPSAGLFDAFATREAEPGRAVQALREAPAGGRAMGNRPLRQAWTSLRRADAAAALFKRLGVSELQGVQGLGGDFASQVVVESAHELLSRAAQTGLAVAVCTSFGARSRWTGEIERVELIGARVTAHGSGVLLHWREDRLASAWLVKTPCRTGLRHSLVLFDGDGRFVLGIEGAHRPGRPEHCQWREPLCSLSEEHLPCRC